MSDHLHRLRRRLELVSGIGILATASNAVVPAGVTTGNAVPVVVTIDGNPTQANVTLAIGK